jgi:hypothetical protein
MMARTKPAAERRGWYHSDLVKVSPATLRFTGDVRPSTYDGKPDWVPFVMEDGTEHTLSIENDGVRATIASAPRDVLLTVHAAGSRDLATVVIDGAVAPKKQPAFMDDDEPDWGPEPHQPDPPPAADWPASTKTPAKPRLSVTLAECLIAAEKVVAGFTKKYGHEPTEAERSIALSFFIEQNRNGGAL